MSSYYIELYSPNGAHLLMLTQATRIEYVKRVNAVGRFKIELPADLLTVPTYDVLAADGRVVVWRRPRSGTRWRVDFAGLSRRVSLYQRGQRMYLELAGVDYNDLLARRIVDAYSGSSEAHKSGSADDVIKAIVREQLGASASDSDRDLSGYGFTVQADLSLGTTVEKEFARRNVLQVLQEIAEQSRATPETAVYFGFVPTGDGLTAEFRTNVGQWGVDRGDDVIFSLAYGNMTEPQYIYDRTDEINYVYSAGMGEGAHRIEGADQYDSDRIAASPLNRREAFYDLRSSDDTTELERGARELLKDGEPLRALLFDAVQTSASRYGVHYELGDVVRGEYAGISVSYHIAGVGVKVTGGREQVKLVLEER